MMINGLLREGETRTPPLPMGRLLPSDKLRVTTPWGTPSIYLDNRAALPAIWRDDKNNNKTRPLKIRAQ